MLDLYVYSIKIEGNDMAALSFLHPEEVQQYGLLTEGVLGDVDPLRPNMTVDGFTPNEGFMQLLSQLIQTHAPQLPALQKQAEFVKNGAVYVIDYRSLNEGEKPPFEDVIGWFGVQNGKIIAESYNPSPHYNILSNAGVIQLEPTLEQLLLEYVRAKMINSAAPVTDEG